jgi:hypothetical protein
VIQAAESGQVPVVASATEVGDDPTVVVDATLMTC